MARVDTASPPIEPGHDPSDARWCWALTAAAAALACYRLGDKGLWYDEVASLDFALRGPAQWVSDHNMALYYALLGGVVRTLGRSELALRSLSASCFVASSAVFFQLARTLFGQRVARIAALLFVSHPTLIHFAQEARGYMLALLLCLASTASLWQLLERRSWRWAIAFATFSALAVYAHLFAAFVVLGQGCAVLPLLLRRDSPRLRWVSAYALLGALVAPLLLQAAHTGAGQVGWLYRPTCHSAWQTLSTLSGGHTLGSLALALAILLCAIRTTGGAGQCSLHHSRADALALSWFLVPVAITYAISLFVTPIVHPKYLLITVPALLLCAARMLAAMPQRSAALALVALGLCNAERLHFWYAEYQRERFREAIADLARALRPHDAVVVEAMQRAPFDYYVERLELRSQLPAPLAPAGPWGLPSQARRDPSSERLQAAFAESPRLWLLTNRVDEHPLRDAIARTHHRTQIETLEPNDEDDRSTFADSSGRIITLELFERGPRPAQR